MVLFCITKNIISLICKQITLYIISKIFSIHCIKNIVVLFIYYIIQWKRNLLDVLFIINDKWIIQVFYYIIVLNFFFIFNLEFRNIFTLDFRLVKLIFAFSFIIFLVKIIQNFILFLIKNTLIWYQQWLKYI
jgi:hypothetical protein